MSSFSLDPKQHFLRARLQQVGAGSGQQTGAGAGSGQQTGAGAGSGQQTGAGAGSGQQTGAGAGSGQQTGAGAGSGQHFGAGQHFETRGLLQQQSNRPACVFSVATTKVIAATRANTNLFIWGSLN